MSYHGAIWIRMNPDRDSGYDRVEECLPKVPQLQFRHVAEVPAESKYPTPPHSNYTVDKNDQGYWVYPSLFVSVGWNYCRACIYGCLYQTTSGSHVLEKPFWNWRNPYRTPPTTTTTTMRMEKRTEPCLPPKLRLLDHGFKEQYLSL